MPDPDDLRLDPRVEREFVEPSADAFRRLVAVMATLRTECPWDREQTHQTLARHLLEETYETLETIDAGDLTALREELGDLVLQVVFHSNIAFEEGAFTVADVLDDLRAKLIRRHPHVFGDVKVADASEVKSNWERIKQDEKRKGVMEGIPKALPALARATKVWTRGRQAGFLIDEEGGATREKLAEEIAELSAVLDSAAPDPERIEAEIGDVLFIVAALAQRHGVDAESALRRQLERAEARFAAVERAAGRDGSTLESLSPDEWRRYWDQAKQEFP